MVILIYLNNAAKELRARRAAARSAFTREDLHEAIMIGAVERVRPKIMTVVAIMAGLSSTVLTLIVIPAIYSIVKRYGLKTPFASRERSKLAVSFKGGRS